MLFRSNDKKFSEIVAGENSRKTTIRTSKTKYDTILYFNERQSNCFIGFCIKCMDTKNKLDNRSIYKRNRASNGTGGTKKSTAIMFKYHLSFAVKGVEKYGNEKRK